MADLGRTRPMQRLLQGEVGSGKTLVALRAMLAVVDAGGQAALLAPTEVLAAQHFQTITRMLGDLASGGTLGAPEQATGVVLITGSSSAGAVGRQPCKRPRARLGSSSAPTPCSAPMCSSPTSGWSWSMSSIGSGWNSAPH